MEHDFDPVQVSPANREVEGPVPLALRTIPRARVPRIGPVLVAGVITLLISETAVRCGLWMAATILHSPLPEMAVRAATISTAAFTVCVLMIYRVRCVLALDEARWEASLDFAAPEGASGSSTEARIANR